eukprot:6767994-Prymnesium_polylepis.1
MRPRARRTDGTLATTSEHRGSPGRRQSTQFAPGQRFDQTVPKFILVLCCIFAQIVTDYVAKSETAMRAKTELKQCRKSARLKRASVNQEPVRPQDLKCAQRRAESGARDMHSCGHAARAATLES